MFILNRVSAFGLGAGLVLAGCASPTDETAVDPAGRMAAPVGAEPAAEAPEAADKAAKATHKPKEAAEKAEEAAGKPKEAAEKAEEAADKPEEAADKAEEAADKPEEAADKAEDVADEPEEAAEKAEEAAPGQATEPKEPMIPLQENEMVTALPKGTHDKAAPSEDAAEHAEDEEADIKTTSDRIVVGRYGGVVGVPYGGFYGVPVYGGYVGVAPGFGWGRGVAWGPGFGWGRGFGWSRGFWW